MSFFFKREVHSFKNPEELPSIFPSTLIRASVLFECAANSRTFEYIYILVIFT